MKTTVYSTAKVFPAKLEYPMLMQLVTNPKIVVLFITHAGGIRLQDGNAVVDNGFYNGFYSIDSGKWQRFEGQVTLEND